MLVIVGQRDFRPDPNSLPAIVLHEDNWDDFGLKTTFEAIYLDADGSPRALGDVKILQFGMNAGRVEIPISPGGLSDAYASLGASYDYYERIAELPTEVGADILKSLRDLATDPAILELAQRERAYGTSLTRMSPAQNALRRIQELVRPPIVPPPLSAELSVTLQPNIVEAAGTATATSSAVAYAASELVRQRFAEDSEQPPGSDPLILKFTPPSGKELAPSPISFDFSGPDKLPRGLIALIGANGTGKTSLLSDLAMTVFFGQREADDADADWGRVEFQSGSVRNVIFVSYSAYDTFEVPRQQPHQNRAEELERQGYVYLGLRDINITHSGASARAERRVLKSISDIESEFSATITNLKGEDGRRDLHRPSDGGRRKIAFEAIRTIFTDPSIAKISPLSPRLNIDATLEKVRTAFAGLSTGHKAILNIIASLCVHLSRDSLVLMDEPEVHLHPPLVAILVKVIRDLLEKFGAHAILATHSPVVVQETLRQHVITLDRVGSRTSWWNEGRETYGANVGALTRECFGLPAEGADYVGHLAEMVTRHTTLEEIEALFERNGMSSPARAEAIRLIAEKQSGSRR